MRRREVIALFCTVVAWPIVAHAQHPTKVRRIGYLELGSPSSVAPHLEAFRRGLADLGWVENTTIVIETRVGIHERLPEPAAELVLLDVELIFAATTPGALAAKQATTTTPIVIGWVADPFESGLVTSLAHPGDNITGWTHQGLDLRAKYLDVLKQAVPAAARVGFLWNPDNPVHVDSLKILKAAVSRIQTR